MTIPDLMSDDYKRPLFRRKRSRLIKWVMRVIIFFIVAIAIVLGVLSMISGSSKELEEAFEKHLSRNLNKNVTFESLNNIEVFPTTKIDFDGLIIKPVQVSEDTDSEAQDLPEPQAEVTQDTPTQDTPTQDNATQAETPDEQSQETPESQVADEEKDAPRVIAEPGTASTEKADQGSGYDLKVEKFSIEISFWDLMFGIEAVNDLTLEGLHYPASKEDELDVVIDLLELTPEAYVNAEDGGALPGLVLKGMHGDRPMNAQINLPTEMNTNQNIVNYRLDRPSPFLLEYAGINADGIVRMLSQREIRLDKLTVRNGEKLLTSGRVYHKAPKEGEPRILSGQLVTGDSETYFDLAIHKKEEVSNWTGRVHVGPLRLKDFSGSDAVIPLIIETIQGLSAAKNTESENDETQDNESPENQDVEKFSALSEPYLDLDVRLEPVNAGNEKMGAVDFSVIKNETSFRITEIDGIISKGNVKGHSDFLIKEDGATLNASLEILDVAYGEFQEALTDQSFAHGDADLHINLSGKGANAKELRSNLDGRFSLIAGQGTMASSALNFWGGGLLNAILPTKDKKKQLDLNCALIDFKIENGVAESQSVFMDTAVLQLVGKGQIDLIDETINMVLTPKAKKTAVIDVATAVNVSGSLFDPNISPNTLSVGKKLGGLLLGAVNPALLVVSMTDFGLSKEHPCAETIQGLESEIADQKVEAEKIRAQQIIEQEKQNKSETPGQDTNQKSQEKEDVQ